MRRIALGGTVFTYAVGHTILALVAAALLTPLGAALAFVQDAPSPEQQLVDRHAPILILKEQERACDENGETE